MNAGLSRWTMAYFATALSAFVIAQLLMAVGLTYPATPLLSGHSFVGVHLLTIGWLTLLMIGALLQFVPVITGKAAIGGRAGLVSLVAIAGGLVGMTAGFLAIDGSVPSACLMALPVGGAAVVVGAFIAAATIGRALLAGRPLVLPARFVAVGLLFLAVTVILGLSFALTLAFPEQMPFGQFLGRGIELHVASGFLGWFTLTAMGVGYRLLSMFMLAADNERIGTWVLRLATTGIALVWIAAFLDEGMPVPVATAAVLVLLAAAALYLADMVCIFRRRKRPKLELNSIVGAISLGFLAIAGAAIAALGFTGQLAEFAGPLGYLFLFGWLSGLGLGQLYKIVPFLTWLERYAPRLGKEPVPRVQDLVDERRATPWYIVYFAAVLVGSTAGALGYSAIWRVAIVAHLVATGFIIRELWRARYAGPATRTGQQPVSQSGTRSGPAMLSPRTGASP